MLSGNRGLPKRSVSLAWTIACLIVAGCITITHPPQAATDKRSQPGSHAVEEILGEWKDTARKNRLLLWKAYIPKKSTLPTPVVLYSHGAGGNRESNAMLGRHLASHGFAAFHLQHEGSDDKALRSDRTLLNTVNHPGGSDRLLAVDIARREGGTVVSR